MKLATKLATILLTLVAIAHLVRVIYGWEAVVGGWTVPMWVSYIAIVVPGTLAFFMFREHQG